MSNLNSIERKKLENLFKMSTGYVLDFSNRKLQEFIFEYTNIDINEDKYIGKSPSKANRLRTFWELEPDYTVGKLILAFLEDWKVNNNPKNNFLFDECLKIGQRLIGDETEKSDNKIETCFDDIQKNIIELIKQARFTIWIAMAWFTDEKIFSYLVKKQKEGINIQLIINDDDINRQSTLNYEKYFEVYKIKNIGNYQNIMHNKFCVIDLKIVINGSYNWTRKAQYNEENINIIQNREIAEEFASKFINLKTN